MPTSNRDCELLVPHLKLTTTANVTIHNQSPFYAQYNPCSTSTNRCIPVTLTLLDRLSILSRILRWQTDDNIKVKAKAEVQAAPKLNTAKGEMGEEEQVFTEGAAEGAGAAEEASKAP